MNQVLIIFEVDDYEKWKRIAENGAGDRRMGGSREAFVYRDEANHNELVVTYNWDDLPSARKFFESDAFKEQMQSSGVKRKPEIHYIEEMDRLMG